MDPKDLVEKTGKKRVVVAGDRNHNFSIENKKAKWVVPQLSEKEYELGAEFVVEQGRSKIGIPVGWTIRFKNLTIKYKTPAPYKREIIQGGRKRVIIFSDADVHYKDTLAFADLPEVTHKPRIFRIVNKNGISIFNANTFKVVHYTPRIYE